MYDGVTKAAYDCYVDLDEGLERWTPNFHWCGQEPNRQQHVTSFRRSKNEYGVTPTKELHNFSKDVFATAWWTCFQKEKFVGHGQVGRVREPFRGYL